MPPPLKPPWLPVIMLLVISIDPAFSMPPPSAIGKEGDMLLLTVVLVIATVPLSLRIPPPYLPNDKFPVILLLAMVRFALSP